MSQRLIEVERQADDLSVDDAEVVRQDQDFGDERRRATMARMNLREMIFMLHLFGRHHHTQTDPTCPYAQSSGPAPLPPFPAPGPRAYLTVGLQDVDAGGAFDPSPRPYLD